MKNCILLRSKMFFFRLLITLVVRVDDCEVFVIHTSFIFYKYRLGAVNKRLKNRTISFPLSIGTSLRKYQNFCCK